MRNGNGGTRGFYRPAARLPDSKLFFQPLFLHISQHGRWTFPICARRLAAISAGLVCPILSGIQDVQVGKDAVRWTDLLLDFWADPRLQDGQFMDEDEVKAATARGLLTADHIAVIDETRQTLAENFKAIVAEAEALRSQIGARA